MQRFLPVPEGLEGERLDSALARLLGFSRSQAAELIGEGRVLLDGRLATTKSERLRAGDMLDVEIPLPPVEAVPPTPVGMDILYDDDDLVVVDKPVGVAAHPSPGWTGPTVIGALAAAGYRISTSGAAERRGIVHRLDVGTSGVMAVAKSELAYSRLKRAFKQRTVRKLYHALVQGHLDPMTGTIEAAIGRHPSREWKMTVVEDGRHAVTHYQTIEAMPGASLLEVSLETGRTHQIRVHMSALHHPCLGDLTYGADPRQAEYLGLERQWLHAVELGFEHPRTGKEVVIRSEYASDLAKALELMRA